MRIAMLLHKPVDHDARVRREARALVESGHQVWVLELAARQERDAELDGFHRRSTMPPTWLRARLPRPAFRALMLAGFVREIVRLRPDVVHAHDAAMLLPGLIGARLVGADLVYDSHELATGVPYRERWWAAFVGGLERAIVPRCAAVITVSDGIARRLAERYRLRSPATVVRNVTALHVSGPGGLRARIGIGPEVPLVLHQGAPAPARGCEAMLDAVVQLPEIRFVFLGDPEPGYGEVLAVAIEARGLGSRVTMLPSVPLETLLANTAEADVGITLLEDSCENHRLALPNKLFEYIAAGIPVIASDLPELRMLVTRYGIGWTVAEPVADRLPAAIAGALDARGDQKLAERLRRAAAELNWDRERVRLTELYRGLGGDSGRLARRVRTPA
jgi:glycosyltransferase involved in cell wall biosynthesis